MATLADDLNDEIRENAAWPAKTSADADSVEQHTLGERFAADKHFAGKNTIGNPHRDLRFEKIVSPAAVLHFDVVLLAIQR